MGSLNVVPRNETIFGSLSLFNRESSLSSPTVPAIRVRSMRRRNNSFFSLRWRKKEGITEEEEEEESRSNEGTTYVGGLVSNTGVPSQKCKRETTE